MRVLGIFFASTSLAIFASSPAPIFRQDLVKTLGPHLCENELVSDSRTALSLGIHDSQIAGSIFFDVEPKAFSRSLEQRSGYFGYAWGLCSDRKKAWALHTRSPQPLVNREASIVLPSSMGDHCRSVEARLVRAEGGASHVVPIVENSVALPKGKGVLSISCVPREKNFGTQTWFLVPYGQGAPSLPGEFLFARQQLSDFQSWLQFIRKKEGFQPFEFPSQLHPVLNILSQGQGPFGARRRFGGNCAAGSSKKSLRETNCVVFPQTPFLARTKRLTHFIEHDKTLMRKAQAFAMQESFKLIGENRAHASRLEELAWLLWFSPRHRDLLLNPTGNLVGLSLKREYGLVRLIFVLARTRGG